MNRTPKRLTGEPRTTTNGMERIMSTKRQPSRVNTSFNGDALNGSPAISPKPKAAETSWWMAPSRDEFNEAREKRRPQMQSATEQNVRPNF